MLSMLEDKRLAESILTITNEMGIEAPLEDVQAMIREYLQESGTSEGDCKLLTQSILYQYAYLEKLIRECKHEKDPKGPS